MTGTASLSTSSRERETSPPPPPSSPSHDLATQQERLDELGRRSGCYKNDYSQDTLEATRIPWATMGNVHASNPSGSTPLVSARRRGRFRGRSRRQESPQGSFPSPDEEEFTFPASEPFEERRKHYVRRENRLLKSLKRVQGMARNRRRRLVTISLAEEEEEVCFYQVLEKDSLPRMQEIAWQMQHPYREQAYVIT